MYSSASHGGSVYQMRLGAVISLLNQTDCLWWLNKVTDNATQFHPLQNAPEALQAKRCWCDIAHHETRGTDQDLGKRSKVQYQNNEQID